MEALLSSYIHGYHIYKDILDSCHWQKNLLALYKSGNVYCCVMAQQLIVCPLKDMQFVLFHGGTIIRIKLQGKNCQEDMKS